MQGPLKPKLYDKRPTKKELPLPTKALGDNFVPAAPMMSRYSWYMHPTNTPTSTLPGKDCIQAVVVSSNRILHSTGKSANVRHERCKVNVRLLNEF